MDFALFNRYTEFKSFNPVTNALLLIIATCFVWNTALSFKKWWQYRKKKLPPGPAGIPLFGCLPFLGSEPHKTLHQMRKKYGNIIGLYFGRKYTVALNEYNVMKEAFSHPAALNKAPHLFDHIPQFGFGVENGEKWQEQRRFCMSATRDLGLGKAYFEEMVTDEVNSFVEFLKKTEGKPTDISHALQSSVSSNIIAFLIGRKLDKEKEADKIQLSLDFSYVSLTYMAPARITSVVPGLWKLFQYLRIAGYDKAARIIGNFSAFIREEISGHKNSPKSIGVHDFISIYLEELSRLKNSGQTKHYFSEPMLEGNAILLFAGASDTIFISLEWLLRLMSEYKDIQAKVYAELMDFLGKEGKARYEDRQNIPYTFAVLMEAQRYSTTSPFISSRITTQDILIKGVTIPKGAEITANLWAIHNDPDYFDEPEKFKPERFLTENGTKLIKNPPSFVPFSVGRRNCPGETVAWMEILTYFTEIIKKFEVSIEPGVKPDYSVVKGLVSFLVPQSLCFKERKCDE